MRTPLSHYPEGCATMFTRTKLHKLIAQWSISVQSETCNCSLIIILCNGDYRWITIKGAGKHNLEFHLIKKSCILVATFSCSCVLMPQRLKATVKPWCEYPMRCLATQKLLSQAQTIVRTVLGSKTCRDASQGQRVLWLLSSCRSFSLHQCLHTLPSISAISDVPVCFSPISLF